MKRTLITFGTILLLIVAMTSLVACSSESTITDTSSMVYGDREMALGDSMYLEVENIAKNYPNRTYGTINEETFATYVSETLAGYGYADESVIFDYKNELTGNAELLTSKNVVFKKDREGTDKAVLITSQLDNMRGIEGYNDEGIYAGATGVAIMLELAKNMRDITLPFDVYFVGFGANSMGLKGASRFYDDFYVHHKKADTLLMIDLSKPVGGDHMYMYTDEKETVHGTYLYSLASNMKFDYRAVPRDKQIMNVAIYEHQPTSYVHAGVLSSNVYFWSARIPTVNFLSVNWETYTSGEAIEREGKSNIAGTSRDNFDFFVGELVGKERLSKEMYIVYDTIMTSFIDEQFVPTMEKSAVNMPEYSIWSSTTLLMGLRLGLAALIIIIAVVISSRFKKDLPMLSMEQFMNDVGMRNGGGINMSNMNGTNTHNNNSNIDPFDDAVDPFKSVEKEFNERDKEEKNKNDDGNDIFGF